MKNYLFGVDIGGTTIKMGFFNNAGELLAKWEIPTNTENNGSNILGDIAEAIKAKLTENNSSLDDVEGVGVGVPGPVGDDGTIYKCVNLGWGVFNAQEELSGLLNGVKVKVGNDANVAALGEMYKGGGVGYNNIVMVTLGTGVGGGVIIDGKILSGANGAAGEIGHMPMNDEEECTCGCGKKGCLEQYGSATGVVRLAERYLAANSSEETSLKSLDTITAKDVFDAAKADDAVALKVVDQMATILGKGMAMISCVVNPEAFVIGGGVSKAGDILINSIIEHYKKYAFHASRETEFKIATLGNDAGIYGGVKMVL